MQPSFANVDPTKMALTPSRVSWNGIDLGGTINNVVVKPSVEKADIKADQFGTSVLDRRIKGSKITVETVLTETKNKDKWMVAFPSLRDATVGPDRVVDFLSKVGESDLAKAKPLLLHPLSLPDTDQSCDFYAWLAVAEEVSEITYGPEQQQGLKVVWNLYLDTSVQPARLARFGDKDIVVNSGTGIAAQAFLVGGGPMEFFSTILGAARNTNTFTVQVLAAAPNPSNLVIAALTGTGAATVITITPNDGTNNAATPVSITEAQLAELINTGAVSGKSVALSDPSSLRARQTARVIGAGATSLANGGAIDGQVATFAGGVD